MQHRPLRLCARAWKRANCRFDRHDQQDSQKGLLSYLTNWPRPARSANAGVQQPLWSGDTGEITTGVTLKASTTADSCHGDLEAAPKRVGVVRRRRLPVTL